MGDKQAKRPAKGLLAWIDPSGLDLGNHGEGDGDSAQDPLRSSSWSEPTADKHVFLLHRRGPVATF
jgi:hypothetical protein